MQVEVIAWRSLQITFLEWLSMPCAITFGNVHVIHVDRNPHIRSRIGYLVINMLVNKEVIRLGISILNIINTRLVDARKVELHIIILKIITPCLDIALESFFCITIFLNTHQSSCSLWLVLLIKLYNSNLWLIRHIANLRESNIWFTNPTRNGIWLYCPCDNFASLALWQFTTQYEPAVLCQHTSII